MKNLNFHYFKNCFFYYINNKEQFHDAYKNKSSKNENKTKLKNDINADFVVIFYYVMIKKINAKLIYRKCYKKFAFNNLLHTYFKSKSYRWKIIKLKKLSKDKKITYNSILIKKSFIVKVLKSIKLIVSFSSSNEMSFRF